MYIYCSIKTLNEVFLCVCTSYKEVVNIAKTSYKTRKYEFMRLSYLSLILPFSRN